MEVVAAGSPATPAGPYKHDVQEWHHLDRLTGVLHQGRREAGSWTTDQQQYGKVIDTQSLVGDGLRGLRTRQLEVFTTRSPGQQLQVVRTTSSSSTSTHWRSQQQKPTTNATKDFDDLEVSVNKLDLTSQRNKANIGRSGSLSSRRPPTRLTSTRPSILDRQNGDGKEQNDTVNDIDNWRSSFGQKSINSDSNRRLSTALRNNSVDLEALDQILKSISSETSSKEEESNSKVKKRNSFVTAESLQEVRGRLRRLSVEQSEKEDICCSFDDGIELKKEDMLASNPVSKVRTYVYGMEMLNKKPIIGTGSLESRTSNKTNTSSNRSEDWYNRRKSYGFEQVHNQNETGNNILRKNKIESSTDSGICRSSEIVVVPQILQENKFKKNSTVINLNTVNSNKDNELFNVWNRRSIISEKDNSKKDVEQITITIPIVDENINSIKRHSIAVDETKYVNDKYQPRRISLAVESSQNNDYDEEDTNMNKKHKKVEFCKTEVHFAADSGRVNIVETDEKPPPTQNFRRRRRNSLTLPEDFNKNGLPIIRFGDTSYEKKLFGITDETNEKYDNEPMHNVTISSVLVNNYKEYEQDNNEIENPPRGILKNKLTKPRPYLLGDDNNELINNDDENTIWGVKLRPVHKEEIVNTPQMWKSTVTVQNTSYIDDEVSKTEFQKLLHNLKPARRLSDTEKTPEVDFQRSSVFPKSVPSWSVADRVKQVEDLKEVKGYSTKINFNSGEATVVEMKQDEPKPHEDSLITSRYDKNISQEAKVTSVSVRLTDKSSNSSLDSPIGHSKKLSHLSSPSLVGSSIKSRKPESVIQDKFVSDKSAFSKVTRSKESPQLHRKLPVRKVETVRKIANKPDLLQFNDNREYENITSVIETKPKSEPIYENIDDVITNLQQMEKESVMLQELTKAADQILQAVNGYTDEDSKHSESDDDKKHRLKLKKNLSTISETKSWKQQTQTKVSTTKLRKPKTSSTSSIESIRESKPVPPVRLNRAVKLNEAKRKMTNTHVEISKATRARRLQRASSREALLHSQGSSSEDIAQEIVRKPRPVRRTRTTTEDTKKISTRRTQSERETVLGLQEIRHKTAVSTIRSTAEKNALKAREEGKKRSLVKPTVTVRGAVSSSRDVPKSTKRYVKEGSTKY